MFKDLGRIIEEKWISPKWESFEVAHLTARPVDIAVGEKAVLKAILLPDNQIFVPVNSKSDNPILEKIKEINRKSVEPNQTLFVNSIKVLLGVPNACVTQGCWTAIEAKYHSTGVRIALDNAEKLNVESLFQNLHQIFPQLTLSKGKLPK